MPRALYHRGEVINNVAAKNRIPTAEIAVKARRTFGLANVVVALPIMLIRNVYHEAETIA